MKTIGVVTGGRPDYGIYRPLLRAITRDSELKLCLIATGMHLSPEFGLTVREIQEDGFPVEERLPMLLSADTPEAIAKSMGLGTIAFAQLFAKRTLDVLVVLGDRFEMHAAAIAALPFKLPVAHIHGGEITEGAIDDALRHSITKLSHLHFVSTDEYAHRIMQMGEEPWRVFLCGALSLDNLRFIRLLAKDELEHKLGIRFAELPIMVTFHSVTLEYEQTEWQVRELLRALAPLSSPMVFSIPNADTNGRLILEELRRFANGRANTCVVESLGTEIYFSLMAYAGAMVGNSSSGIIEAPSFKLPVVNIGNRQRGRIRARNVIDTGYSSQEITAGIERALSMEFRSSLSDMSNPYGRGMAAERIVEVLRNTALDGKLVRKQFAAALPEPIKNSV
jgi:UDP-hydrolysing UDP-N-acetyl-D-glucosamine 2-epimerase